MTSTPSAPAPDAPLDPRLAELARVLGRSLARRRLRDHRAADSHAGTIPSMTPETPPWRDAADS